MATFIASSEDDVIRTCAAFERMSGKSIEGKDTAIQVKVGTFSWKSVTFRELLAWPFDGPIEFTIYELDSVE